MAGHARRARKSMRDLVQIIDNGSPVWVCPAKITATPKDARVVDQTGQAITLRTYDVDLPNGTPVPAGDAWFVKVLASLDPRLKDVTLDVLDQPLGYQATVRLVCVHAT